MKRSQDPINASKSADRKLVYYRKKDGRKNAVHMVLADIWRHLDETNGRKESSDEQVEDELQIFQSPSSRNPNTDGEETE